MEGVFRFKSWFLSASGLIHCGAYYRNFYGILRGFIRHILNPMAHISHVVSTKSCYRAQNNGQPAVNNVRPK